MLFTLELALIVCIPRVTFVVRLMVSTFISSRKLYGGVTLPLLSFPAPDPHPLSIQYNSYVLHPLD